MNLLAFASLSAAALVALTVAVRKDVSSGPLQSITHVDLSTSLSAKPPSESTEDEVDRVPYTAIEWEFIYQGECQRLNKVRDSRFLYAWNGGTLEFKGRLVPRDSLALDAQRTAKLPNMVFQPDPIKYAQLMCSPLWERNGLSPALRRAFGEGPANCTAEFVQNGSEGFTSRCPSVVCPPDFMLGEPIVCQGNTYEQPSYCGCTPESMPPSNPPDPIFDDCWGLVTIIDPLTAQLDCNGQCTSNNTCQEQNYVDAGGDVFFCQCK